MSILKDKKKLMLLGAGAALLAVAGTAIYFVTRKPAAKKPEPDDGGDGGSSGGDTTTCVDTLKAMPMMYLEFANGSHLSAGDNGYITLEPNKDTWEQWVMKPSPVVADAVCLYNPIHKTYFTANPDGGVMGNETKADTWESFKVTCLGNNKIALLSFHGLWLTVKDGVVSCATKLDTPGANQTITVVSV